MYLVSWSVHVLQLNRKNTENKSKENLAFQNRAQVAKDRERLLAVLNVDAGSESNLQGSSTSNYKAAIQGLCEAASRTSLALQIIFVLFFTHSSLFASPFHSSCCFPSSYYLTPHLFMFHSLILDLTHSVLRSYFQKRALKPRPCTWPCWAPMEEMSLVLPRMDPSV